jgi:hypothetical protein
MNRPVRPTPRESTEAMVQHIGSELAEIEQAMRRCRGDWEAEAQLTGTWMAHLLISGAALVHNLLIDTAQKPRRIELRETNARGDGTRENPQARPGG